MNIYETHALRGVVEFLGTPKSFLLDAFFPMIQTSDSEKIDFDVETGKRRITPFVAPIVAGRVVEGLGYTTNTFAPAYAKDKRILKPDAPLKRAIGEAIGGSLSPMERRALALRREIQDQLAMLTMREEIMASEALRTGKVTVDGEGFDSVLVDFGRAAALTVATLTANDRWTVDHADSLPMDDLETWAALIQSNDGPPPTDIVMDPLAWQAARKKTAVTTLLDTRRGSTSQAELGPLANTTGRFIGYLGDFRLWVYQQTYVDEDGNSAKVIPDYTVIMGSPAIEGVRAYGAIQDEKAGYTAQRYFIKSWLEEDPAVRWLLLQSAPLTVPYRPNASLCATIHGSS